MKIEDEAELERLADLLQEVSQKNVLSHDETETLKKAALALSVSFIHGLRDEIEDMYEGLGEPLTNVMKQHLRSVGIDPDNDRNN